MVVQKSFACPLPHLITTLSQIRPISFNLLPSELTTFEHVVTELEKKKKKKKGGKNITKPKLEESIYGLQVTRGSLYCL